MRELYERLCRQSSDIYEHLPTMHALALSINAQTIIELGVRTGVSSAAWLSALERTGGHLWSVDVALAPRFVSGHRQCTFLQGDDLAPVVTDQLPLDVDIVFIDTDHRYELTVDEIAVYAPRVKSGGFMVFHDTAVEVFPHHPPGQPPFPVRKAVQGWLESDPGWRAEWRENCNGLAVVQRIHSLGEERSS